VRLQWYALSDPGCERNGPGKSCHEYQCSPEHTPWFVRPNADFMHKVQRSHATTMLIATFDQQTAVHNRSKAVDIVLKL
jgi:hypothetical protein